MADQDVEALLQEDLDLDYEVDEELQEEDLLAENDDFVLSGDDTYQEQQATQEEENPNNTEQEEDVLEIGVNEDVSIDDLEDEHDGNKRERERFHSERTNTSGHTPIVFDENQNSGEHSFRQNKFVRYRGVGGRMRGMRGRGGMARGGYSRGNFHNEQYQGRGSKLIYSRLGHRVSEFNETNPNLHVVTQVEPKKVLINPHFRGNVQTTHDARLVWDAQNQQPFRNPQVFQQPLQNVDNFSQPVMQQPHVQPQPMQQQFWNNPPEQQYYPQQVEYNPPMQMQTEIYPQHQSVHYEPQPPMTNQLGPMFIQPNHQQINQSYETTNWYPQNVGAEMTVRPEPFHFKHPTQPPFRHRVPNRFVAPRFQQPQIIQNTPPVYNQQPVFPQNVRHAQPYEQPNYQYQQPYQQVQFQPNFQQFTPRPPNPTFNNRVVKNGPRLSHVHRSPQKRPLIPQHDNELIKKKKTLEFRNLQEVPRVDVPDTTSFIEDRTPMPIEVEEEDEETKAYRLKIEEQRKLRELVLKKKEERRKRAAMEQQQAEIVQNLQKVTSTEQPKIKPLLQQKQVKPKQLTERVLVPVANTQNRVILVNQPPVKKILKTPLVKKVPNAVSSTQKTVGLLQSKRVVRAITRKQPTTVEATSSSSTTEVTSESGDDVIDKEHLSQFLSTRIVVPKVAAAVTAPVAVISSSNANGAVADVPVLMKSNLVKICNLSASTNEQKLRKMCKGVGIIQEIKMSPNLGVAVIRFKNIPHAHNFYKKYQRKMVDLSLIDIQLVPPPS